MTRELPTIEPLTKQEKTLLIQMVEVGLQSGVREIAIHRGYSLKDEKQRKWLREYCIAEIIAFYERKKD